MVPRLSRLGVSKEDLLAITQRNPAELLAWWTPPPPPPPPPKLWWSCDGPCAGRYLEGAPSFTRLEHRYCSLACLKAHRAVLEAGTDGGQDTDSGGGGGGGRGGGGGGDGSWGVCT